jgi:hypothetical protein
VGRALRARQIAGLVVGRKKAQEAQESDDGFFSQRSRSADTEEAGDGRQIGEVGRPLRGRLAL